jgi:hypothetical protein
MRDQKAARFKQPVDLLGASKPDYHDNIREASGKQVRMNKMPITLDHKCLGHLSTTKDKELTMKLFKSACLAYNPAKVQYREHILERSELI